MSIIKFQNNYTNSSVSGLSNIAFKGRKKDVSSTVDLTQKPDTVSFSKKTQVENPPKSQEEVFSDIENYITDNTLNCVPTESAFKEIVKIVDVSEKQGSKIDAKELASVFRKFADSPIRVKNKRNEVLSEGSKFQARSHYYLMQRNLISMANLIDKTPQKENETTAVYLKRINSANTKRNKQLEKGRISIIKAKLDYASKKQQKEEFVELSPYAKQALIDAINWEIDASDLACEKLSDDADMKDIIPAFQYVYVCDMEISKNNKELQDGVLSVLQRLGRYDSSNPPKTEDFGSVLVVDKDYKSEFKYEPVYRWLSISDAKDFIKNFPKNGEFYSYPKFQSCSTNKKFAEDDFNDAKESLNVKFVLHPKSQISKAYNLGIGQEVIYPPNTKFKVLDKTLVEDIIDAPKAKGGAYSICRWEIHMQEV